jgi:hypothetical protein
MAASACANTTPQLTCILSYIEHSKKIVMFCLANLALEKEAAVPAVDALSKFLKSEPAKLVIPSCGYDL